MDRPVVAFEVVSAPASEPVTLTEVKAQCRVLGTDEDDFLTALIVAARELVELHTERALITQTRRMWLDAFPRCCCQVLAIPLKPISSISSIQYIDPAGEWQTVAAEQYVTDLVSAPARIQPAFGLIWPETIFLNHAVRVQFVCGAATAPAMAKHAIKLLVGHWFENREAVGKVSGPIALGFNHLVESLKWH